MQVSKRREEKNGWTEVHPLEVVLDIINCGFCACAAVEAGSERSRALRTGLKSIDLIVLAGLLDTAGDAQQHSQKEAVIFQKVLHKNKYSFTQTGDWESAFGAGSQ